MIEIILLCAVAAVVVAVLVVLCAGLAITLALIASLWVTTKAHTFWQSRLGRRVESIATPDIIGRQWRLFDPTMTVTEA